MADSTPIMSSSSNPAVVPFETDLSSKPSSPTENYSFDPTATGTHYSTTFQTPTADSNAIPTDNPLLEPYSTLNEPIGETILRDIRAVTQKLRVVLLPLDRYESFHPKFYTGVGTSDEESEQIVQEGSYQQKIQSELRKWDLWGPLLITLLTSVLLSIEATAEQTSSVFAAVFVLVWVGASIVALNAQMLGGSISFFQSICVFGYCVFPLTLSALLIAILRHTPLGRIWLNIIWVMVGYVWSTRASTVFIGQFIVKERRALAVFPVLFFYLFLSWMILLI